jgi:hypothetical protein
VPKVRIQKALAQAGVASRRAVEELVIDGYDIVRTVTEAWGDSDYEYVITIPSESVASLYALLGTENGNRTKLLEAIAARFQGNHCFSAIGDFLDENGLAYRRLTWA